LYFLNLYLSIGFGDHACPWCVGVEAVVNKVGEEPLALRCVQASLINPRRVFPHGVLANLAPRWCLFFRRLSTRKALLGLSDAQLRDIGLSREQAKAEAQLPFWSVWERS
jgi:uncharacterized protein YjiS (DUF1127 family)